MRIRYLLAAAMLTSALAASAEDGAKAKQPFGKPEISIATNSALKAAKKDAADKMKKEEEQAELLKKEQMKKADEMKKEMGKGSEKGQAMREEHSRKWWKFWGGEKELSEK